MPNSCKTCRHWKPLNPATQTRNDGPVGECRARPPAANFAWHKTRDVDFCSEHAVREIAPSETEQLSLDTQDAAGGAPPPPARSGTGGGGAGNRPRRASAASATPTPAPASPAAS